MPVDPLRASLLKEGPLAAASPLSVPVEAKEPDGRRGRWLSSTSEGMGGGGTSKVPRLMLGGPRGTTLSARSPHSAKRTLEPRADIRPFDLNGRNAEPPAGGAQTARERSRGAAGYGLSPTPPRGSRGEGDALGTHRGMRAAASGGGDASEAGRVVVLRVVDDSDLTEGKGGAAEGMRVGGEAGQRGGAHGDGVVPSGLLGELNELRRAHQNVVYPFEKGGKLAMRTRGRNKGHADAGALPQPSQRGRGGGGEGRAVEHERLAEFLWGMLGEQRVK